MWVVLIELISREREREREREKQEGVHGTFPCVHHSFILPTDSHSTSSKAAPPGVTTRRGGRVTAAIVKKDPSPSAVPLMLGSLLSPSDMTGQAIASMKAKEEKKEMVRNNVYI